jgi:iron complex outermembrane receptor protein
MNLFAKKRSARTVPGSSAFPLSPVAAGCAVFMALASHAVYAQETTNTQDAAATGATNSGVTTVKVTGIRRGIEAAISVKKNSDSIVEAISAEDIGKLPDQSIAESISRLPGLTAQRDIHGNASVISIRGMSPDFSTGLLNGREQVSTGDSRSIEFDMYPGELLSGVVVYKTPDAGLVGQGLSGTVDLQTVRPLDFSKRTMAVNYRREKSGLGMDTKGQRQPLHLLLHRPVREPPDRYRLRLRAPAGTKRRDQPLRKLGRRHHDLQRPDRQHPVHRLQAFSEVYSQARNGFMGVIQYRPAKEFTSTLDLFYSKYDRATRNRGIQAPLNDATNNAYDQPGQLVNRPCRATTSPPAPSTTCASSA